MGVVVVDESFKKPGAIPFKWEVRPGVPKTQHNHQHQEPYDEDHSFYSLPSTPHKQLTPPPPYEPCFTPPPDLRTRSSLRSTSRLRCDRGRFEPPLLARPKSVSTGCFLAPWFRWKRGKKKSVAKLKLEHDDQEPDYTLELETLARWSMSTRRKSLSPLSDSPSSSSFSSHWSSPRPVGDAEWAGFGLF